MMFVANAARTLVLLLACAALMPALTPFAKAAETADRSQHRGAWGLGGTRANAPPGRGPRDAKVHHRARALIGRLFDYLERF